MGWAPTVDGTNAIIMYTATDGAVYKGLALAADSGANFLYATDFHNNKVDVFDKTFPEGDGRRWLHRLHAARRLCAVRHPGA